MRSRPRLIGFVVFGGPIILPVWAEEFGGKAMTDLPWTKSCIGDTCFTGSGKRTECRPVVNVTLVESKGGDNKRLSVTLPKTVDTGRAVRIQIDGAETISLPFDKCSSVGVGGCTAVYEGGPELADKLAQGKLLAVEAVDGTNSPLRLTLPLAGFATAHDGPGLEPKVIEHIVSEEEMRALQEKAKREKEERELRCGPDE